MAIAAIDLVGAKVNLFYDENFTLKYYGTVFAKVGRDYDIDETDFLVAG